MPEDKGGTGVSVKVSQRFGGKIKEEQGSEMWLTQPKDHNLFFWRFFFQVETKTRELSMILKEEIAFIFFLIEKPVFLDKIFYKRQVKLLSQCPPNRAFALLSLRSASRGCDC